jgi:hypothetical protein
MSQQFPYSPILMGPYSRKRRLFSPARQYAVLALASVTIGAALAFVL